MLATVRSGLKSPEKLVERPKSRFLATWNRLCDFLTNLAIIQSLIPAEDP